MALESVGLGRRDFLRSVVVTGALAATGAAGEPAKRTRRDLKLGLDNFAVRAMNWKAPALIDYAAKLELDSLFISDLDAFESLEPSVLAEVRRQATERGLQLHVGTWSICPTSQVFKDKWGTAEEHLRLGIRTAEALGSPVIRVVLGHGGDRLTPGGIDARIRDTVAVCRACRSQAMDAGVKIAVENHAGDLRSPELVRLVEEAGRDYVGVNMDSGNAVWALEDPLTNLENLGPYVATTSLRDSALWPSENGFTAAWTAMGEGQVDWPRYFDRFAELCPDAPVHIETISGFNREFNYLQPEFWKPFAKVKAREFAPLLALAKAGRPRAAFQAPEGVDKQLAQQEFQRGDVERSVKYCKKVLRGGA